MAAARLLQEHLGRFAPRLRREPQNMARYTANTAHLWYNRLSLRGWWAGQTGLTAAKNNKTEVKKRVEMINQMLDQLTAAQLSQTAPSQDRQQSKDGVDFDGLLQQKRQEAERPAQSQDKQDAQKADAPKAEAGKPQAAQQGQEDEVPEDAAAVLAAMMLQPQQQAEAPQVQAVREAAPVVEAVEAPIEAAPQQQDAAVQAAPQETAQVVQTQMEVQTPAEAPQAAEQAAPQQVSQQVQTPEQPQTEAPAEQAAPETAVQAAPQEGRAEGQAAEADAAADAGQTQQDETAGEVPVETPVFQQAMDAAPVKVAEPVLNPENPVHIEGEEAPQGIVDAMQQCMDTGKEESIGVIQIEPENLGPVTMRLTRDGDGVIHMVLEALNPKTAALLDKHAANIQNIAAENTHQEVRVEIKSEQNQPFPENWKDGQNQHGQQQQQRQGQQREEREASMEDFMHRLRLGLTGTDAF